MQSTDHARHSRRRLEHLGPDQRPVAEPDPAVHPPRASGGPVEAPPQARGWRGRWLPARWQGARVDPGRHGALALAGVAALAAVIAAFGVWRDRPVPQPAPALPAVSLAPVGAGVTPTVAGAPSAAPTTLIVSVAGKVRTPGLVTVAPGARIADALSAAGGVVPGTDLLALNLAQPLTDGQQILVGVAAPPGAGSVSGGTATATAPTSGAKPSGGLVNLNSAAAPELEALPGVGPVMAKAIVDWRTKNGNFRSVEQLSQVSGIGPARLAQLRELVTV